MKPFNKSEVTAVIVIFLILIGISVPNFIVSLRRARDQVRKDDMGALEHGLGEYLKDFTSFPLASSDGKIIACKNPGDQVQIDKKGRLVVNLRPCEWGHDAIIDFTPGSTKEYLHILPLDPNADKGATYHYFSDGQRFQIFVALEGKEDVEYDSKIISRNISCGSVICNAGRSYGCATDKTLEQCEYEANIKRK
jgi:type II secretory pathway pseudopilin PulG